MIYDNLCQLLANKFYKTSVILRVLTSSDICEGYDFPCGAGFCIAFEAKCNGFQDCYQNPVDELQCGLQLLY